ncbi:MAG: ornithine cyclodeaminase family protein [Dehalococcoidia bacterium]|nr:ornithine cyclodeaminase family protein [Dehalococcoidia bacterium]
MALFLSNDDVRSLLSVGECVSVLEDLFQQEGRGLVENLPRRRARYGKVGTTLMGGAVLGSDAYGVRHGSVSLLYNTESGKLDAVFEPGTLAWIRTGAASGVAAKYLSAPDASVVGLIGAGRQAVTQIEAICAVRSVRQVKVFARTEATRNEFAREMTRSLGVEVVPVAAPELCVIGSQIVVAITSAREPVFDGHLIEPGTCVIAAGSNSYAKREVDTTTIQRASVVAVDNLEQAKIECGELIWAVDRGEFRWQQAVELHQVVSGQMAGRPSPDAITLFESQGIGIEDVAGMAYVLKKARAAEVGVQLPF